MLVRLLRTVAVRRDVPRVVCALPARPSSLPQLSACARRPASVLVGAAALSTAAAAPAPPAATMPEESPFYSIPIATLDGQTTTLAEFKDDLVLVVNVASA